VRALLGFRPVQRSRLPGRGGWLGLDVRPDPLVTPGIVLAVEGCGGGAAALSLVPRPSGHVLAGKGC